MTDFTKRKINVRIIANKLTKEEREINLEGLRCSAHTSTMSYQIQGRLSLNIWGLSLERMNSLTTFGPIMAERRANQIFVSAGDENGDQMQLVYAGYISNAFADMNGAPNVRFSIVSSSGAYEQALRTKARSHKGARDAAEILREIAEEAGWTFENNGVSVVLRDRTYNGTLLMQAVDVVKDANICANVDKGFLRIWPKTGGKNVRHELSVKTGMVGYPTFSGKGVMCTMRFNPDISCGDIVDISSTIAAANGDWRIVRVFHDIESETPGGPWFTRVYAYGVPLR